MSCHSFRVFQVEFSKLVSQGLVVAKSTHGNIKEAFFVGCLNDVIEQIAIEVLLVDLLIQVYNLNGLVLW